MTSQQLLQVKQRRQEYSFCCFLVCRKVVVGPTLGNMEAVRSLFAPPASRGLETLNNCDIIKPNCESLLNRARLCDAIQPARLPFISV